MAGASVAACPDEPGIRCATKGPYAGYDPGARFSTKRLPIVGEKLALSRSDGRQWQFARATSKMYNHFLVKIALCALGIVSFPVKGTAAVGAKLSAGFGTTFLIDPYDGELRGAGANDVGQIGDGTTINRASLVSVAENVDRVASAGRSTFFLKRDGTLWGMGANQSGALGSAIVTFVSRPVQVAASVIDFAVTPEELFYITADQTLWGQGKNTNGVLGNGTTSPSLSPIRIAAQVRGVESNGLKMFYWTITGQLYACGRNIYRELGDGTTTTRLSPVTIGHTASAVSSYGNTTFSLGSTGRVYSWGESGVSTPQEHLATGDFTALSAELALRRNGDLWRLSNAPGVGERIAEGVIAFASSGTHLVFMDRDGFLYTKGVNRSGELTAGNFSPFSEAYGFLQRGRYALPGNDLSPQSLFGRTAHLVIADGTGVFSSSGSYRMAFDASGSRYSVTPVSSGITPSSGTYSYQKTGGPTATLGLIDSVVGPVGSNSLIFYAPNYATYSVIGSGGSQSGALYLQETPIIYPMIRPQTVASGTVAVNWYAVVRGVPTLNYRWFRNGVSLPGETTSRLVTNNTTTAMNGTRYSFEVSNQAGGVRSNEVVLTVVPRASAGAQPSVAVSTGGRMQLSPQITTSGLPTSYQWFRRGVRIEGATSATLTIEPAAPEDSGPYSLLFGDAIAGARAEVLVTVSSLPALVGQPQPFSASTGQSASFAVAATGSGLTYQWRKNGDTIPGATDSSLVIGRVTSSDAGSYSVLVSNPSGSVVSQPAALSVLTSPASRIMNLSIMASLGASESMTLGTVTRGSTPRKRLLFRAAGPSLAQFGITDFALDPTLRVYRGPGVVAENDDWGGSAILASAFRTVGAFAYASSQSLDSAVYGENYFAPSGYTAEIRELRGRVGTVLAEVYDASLAPDQGLVNVSVLKQVPAGTSLTAGFVIGGPGISTKRVMIRAVGPRLASNPFNISGVMPDPVLAVFRAQTQIASNDNWGTQSGGVSVRTIKSTFSSVGAFDISDESSRDAVLLLSLTPGAYTAVVDGYNNSSGLVIVEVYEVP
jgi:hypothetical protein